MTENPTDAAGATDTTDATGATDTADAAGATDTADTDRADSAGAAHGHHGHEGHHGYLREQDRYKARLKRIEGQVRGIHRMIDEEQYCIDILTQVSAVNSALRNVAMALLDDHMRHCVRDAVMAGDEEADEKFKEVADAIARFAR